MRVLLTTLLVGLAALTALAAEPQVPASRFLDRLPSLPAADRGPEPVRVRWDFSKASETGYRFEHLLVTSGEANGLRTPEAETRTVGTLTLTSAGEGTGDLVLVPEMVTVSSGGQTASTGGPKDPVVLPGLGEDGRLPGAPEARAPKAQRNQGTRSEREALLAMLFPFPPEALREGGSSQRGVQVPFTLGPLKVTVQGTATTRLTRWVDLEGARCAELTTEVDLTRVLTPPGTLGSLHAAGRGRSVFYWNPEARCFVRGGLALRIKGLYGYDRPNPIEGLPAIRIDAEADVDQYAELQP